jgi:HlyD family secretion protein
MSFSDAPISFPGLFGDWQFTVPSKALNIGNGIYWYGIIIAAGMLLGLYFCMKQAPKYGLTEDNVIDMVLWGIPFSIIGARLYYVLFYLDLFRSSQLQSLDENIRNMKKSLALVRGRLENLKVKAPVDGQLGNLEAQIGQSIAQGERIGQVITPELKVEAKIDEHYVERVMPGLPASFEREGKKYDMEVTKVYPEVREGQFRTDLHFVSGRPENIRAGQTYHLNLQLGDPVPAVIVPRGSFYQASGGEYMYVVDEEGKTARRRPVRIGRQNPQYYEVVEGLQPGEKVIISGYDLFGENERLILR